MFFRVALAVARARLWVAQRRNEAFQNSDAWVLWWLIGLPLKLAEAWLFDLACLRYRKEPECRV